jgi:XTP/dITP diphosphohydrolase
MNDPSPISLVVATRNQHKVREIQALLDPRWRCQSLQDFPGAPAVVEDAASFSGNATKKAVELACWFAAVLPPSKSNGPGYVLADDSGLEVDALQGAPGVRSARFAAESIQQNSSDAANNAKLLKSLARVPDAQRTARFQCVIALTPISVDTIEAARAQTLLFEGTCEGRIGWESRGDNGFGYDPLFVPHGFALTFAELGNAVKNQISHRARALAGLRGYLQSANV